ncbi:hypothetical protein [Microlunatus soli]|uniref:Uncharacterized protein n=1 Tax=Microlunatus soli TaxID=630515 RepID=A0A1H1QFK4_9ACTN|nr:hypothetical protein [Microlunatus soli]SDS22215.1 hypothetical protein SAMN04489812_1253 [Microlunatus soli]
MAEDRGELLVGLGAPAGLCGSCRFALLNRTRRGTVYLRCGLATEDDRFAKYPRLPVMECSGFRQFEGGTDPVRPSPPGVAR